jgi:D-serine deaminase-like pyridoxal phosphate-dependent protein
MPIDWDQEYDRYRRVLSGRRLPLAFVDLDRFDANVAYVARTQKTSGKTIRVASKSIRCLELIRRVFDKGGAVYQGVMAFTAEEAGVLSENGVMDILVAYPSIQASDMAVLVRAARNGSRVVSVVDCPAHIDALGAAGREAGLTLEACLEIDMAWRPVGHRLHLGVRRSPIRSPRQAEVLARRAASSDGVTLTAVMGYEAQIASVNDNLPARPITNAVFRAVKRLSIADLRMRRHAVLACLDAAGHSIRIVNGGGSGSLASTADDPSVTEVTAGSAFYAPGLFHHFKEVAFSPAAFFALQVSRLPEPGMVTCQGGGYVASGEIHNNKRPVPLMPAGLRYIDMESAGEVQTPLRLSNDGKPLAIGDPVIFQHAKAGELCERFNELHLIQGGRWVGRVPTYRGDGFAFL